MPKININDIYKLEDEEEVLDKREKVRKKEINNKFKKHKIEDGVYNDESKDF